ncbi:MAG: uncharacterized protein K0S79_834 [Nitrospira sp.]|jgi:hypothetical protein|nr:uncharacterized protein [Nitrospira sp.]
MTGYKWFVFGIAFRALLGSSPLVAGPIDWGRHPYPETARAVHEAEHAVDYAWEMYHRAALGGTVASPGLQLDIEEYLHEARTLLVQVHEAAERGDLRQVERLVRQINIYTSLAIKDSKEQKP